MKYNNIVKGTFISRPNRFIAKVNIEGEEHTVHVKNTGRCKELLIYGATVFLQYSDNPVRKTRYDLIAVQKGDKLINMDSQAPNTVFYEWAVKNYPGAVIKREVTYKDSRYDCYIEYNGDRIFTEVKGVTLEDDGYTRFPDAPTERGLKHIYGLTDAINNGYKGQIFFVIQMKDAHTFSPNYDTQPRFAQALKDAHRAGVKIMAYNCIVTKDSLEIYQPVKIELE
ncbi:MAG: DNA/RNA nuclease SfsA [Oscillospiraceae bacterium]|nr:DNA/RNA nuclease SfsA [Oscillospiraceae bacterium]